MTLTKTGGPSFATEGTSQIAGGTSQAPCSHAYETRISHHASPAQRDDRI